MRVAAEGRNIRKKQTDRSVMTTAFLSGKPQVGMGAVAPARSAEGSGYESRVARAAAG
jgi:hypothetical protein